MLLLTYYITYEYITSYRFIDLATDPILKRLTDLPAGIIIDRFLFLY